MAVLVVRSILGHVVPRLFPSLAGSRHGRLSRIVTELNVMSTSYRYRLDAVPAGLSLFVISQALNVLVFFLIGKVLFISRMTATLVQHFLMVPLTLFTVTVPVPFGALSLTEGDGNQLLNLDGHPRRCQTVPTELEMVRPKPLRSGSILWPLVLAVAVLAITAIPYAIGFLRQPTGTVFRGLVEFMEDEDMYFSFIRQAADGHHLFVNRLTSMDHDPVFFNPQWWLVGRIMAWMGDSSQWAYQIWRAAGALGVMFGFSALAEIVLRDRGQRRIALLMCAFGGGFFWLCGLLMLLQPALPMEKALTCLPLEFRMDLMAGTHPFHQILGNPHFSLPLGLFLLFFAWYIRGELTGSPRCYGIAAALAVIEGMMRPYDLIALYTVIPSFLLIELAVTRELDLRKLGLRTLPLVAIAPVLFYNIYIFRYHCVFKYWGSQGNSFMVEVPCHFLSLGLAGVLVAVRLALAKTYPLRTSTERLLLAWMATVFFFCHAHKLPMFHFMPYTFQLGTTIMPPVILLGVVVIDPARWPGWERRSVLRPLIPAAFVTVNGLSSVLLVAWLSLDIIHNKIYYIKITELNGYHIIKCKATDTDVVLCVRETGHRLARYASVRVVVGHWSVTPHILELEPRIARFYRGEMPPWESKDFLEQLGVTWVYWGSNERELGGPDMKAIPGFEKRVINQDVVLYFSRRGGHL